MNTPKFKENDRVFINGNKKIKGTIFNILPNFKIYNDYLITLDKLAAITYTQEENPQYLSQVVLHENQLTLLPRECIHKHINRVKVEKLKNNKEQDTYSILITDKERKALVRFLSDYPLPNELDDLYSSLPDTN